MKMTLLEIVQDILSDMNSDNVNSIDDTVESEQVAQITKSTYYELHSNKNWANTRDLLQLNSSGTLSRPTHMKLPDSVKQIEDSSIKYNKLRSGETRNRYDEVFYLYPEEFLQMLNNRNNTNDNIDVILDINGVDLNIITNKHPEYWTSFDEEYVVMDSYDISVDSTLQNSKTQMIAYSMPAFQMVDSFVPDLPTDAFSLLLAEAKSRAFISIKELPNEKVEQSAQRQGRWLARKAWRTKGGVRYPDYGRKTGKTRSRLFDKGY